MASRGTAVALMVLMMAATAAALPAGVRFGAGQLGKARHFELATVHLWEGKGEQEGEEERRVHPQTLDLRLDAFQRNLTLQLRRNTRLFSPSYVATYADHTAPLRLAAATVNEHCHYHGRVAGDPQSLVALSTCGGSLDGFVIHKGDRWVVQPARHHERFAGAPASQHVVYRHADLAAAAGKSRRAARVQSSDTESVAWDRYPPANCVCRNKWTYTFDKDGADTTATIVGGVCANPDNDRDPWCYCEGRDSSNSAQTWEWCTATEPTACSSNVVDNHAPSAGSKCECLDYWAYEGTAVCGGKCSRAGGFEPWCYTKGECGRSWAYCEEREACNVDVPESQQALKPEKAECKCKESWTYTTKQGTFTTCGGHCSNPDNDQRPWCYTEDADGKSCGVAWSWCGEETIAKSGPSRVVEALLVADHALYSVHGAGTKDHLETVMNQVSTLYTRAGLGIEVQLKASHVFTTEGSMPSAVRPPADRDMETLLRSFSVWQHSLQGKFDENLDSCTSGSTCLDLRHDNAQLLTAVDLSDDTTGLAWVGTMCGSYSAGVDEAIEATAFVADTVAHEMGHNFGADHDTGGSGSACPSDGFVMAAVGTIGASDPDLKWSPCSVSSMTDKIEALEASGSGNCLAPPLGSRVSANECGDGNVGVDEECDEGERNGEPDSLCTGQCALKPGVQCSSGSCCDAATGRFKPASEQCRPATNECDVAEHCAGDSPVCPPDRSNPDGTECAEAGPGGRCYMGGCKGRDAQCKTAWAGFAGTWASGGRGDVAGECPRPTAGCGELLCTNTEPGGLCTEAGCECLATGEFSDMPNVAVEDGTPCGEEGEDKVCLERTCQPRPASPVAEEACSRDKTCSGRGNCVEVFSLGKAACDCDPGYAGDSCETRLACSYDCAAMRREGCRSDDSCGACLPGHGSSAYLFGPTTVCDLEALAPSNSTVSAAVSGAPGQHLGDGSLYTAWVTEFDAAAAQDRSELGPAEREKLPLARIEFSEPVTVAQYDMTSASSQPGMDPSAWMLEASEDGVAWQTVDEQSGVRFGGRSRTVSFAVKPPTEAVSYRHYRFVFLGVANAEFQGTASVEAGAGDGNFTLGNATALPRLHVAELVLYKSVAVGTSSSSSSSSSVVGVAVGAAVGAAVLVAAGVAVTIKARQRQRAGGDKQNQGSLYMGTDLPMAPEDDRVAGSSSAASSLMTLNAVTAEAPAPAAGETGAAAAAPAAAPGAYAMSDLGPLPPGWEELVDESGTPYYINSATNETQWNRPGAEQ